MSSWLRFALRSTRRATPFAEEAVRIEPAPDLRPEHGPALRRCLPLALAALPPTFRCEPEDREGLGADEPDCLAAWLEPASYEATLATVGYYALGFGAAYPFADADREGLARLVAGL